MPAAKGSSLAGVTVALGLSFAGVPMASIAAADSADGASAQSTANAEVTKTSGQGLKGHRRGPSRDTTAASSAAEEVSAVVSGTGSSIPIYRSDRAGLGLPGARSEAKDAHAPGRARPSQAPVIDLPDRIPDRNFSVSGQAAVDESLNSSAKSGSGSSAESVDPSAHAASPIVTDADTNPAPLAAATAAQVTAADLLTANSASAVTEIFSGVLSSIQEFFEGALLLVRRTFFNKAPTVNPVQLTGQAQAPITGTIGAVDPEGEQITYTITQMPMYGSVIVSPDGTYTYSPGSGFNGVDAFTIAAADAGLFHLNLLDLFRAPSTEAVVSVTQGTVGAQVNFNFIYGAGAQFASAAARSALQTTAILLSSYFDVSEPVTINYTVTGEYSPFSSTLATAGSDLVSYTPGFHQTVVQNKILTGVDSNGSAADGQITWNFGNSWGYGSSVSNTQYDFQSTAMHELLHTFGFLSNVNSPGSNTGTNWTFFDSFIVTDADTKVIASDFKWKTAYNSNLTGSNGGLYFGGPNAVAAYGGLVPLYTPSPWQSGSSISHLDDSTFTGSNSQLMNAVSEAGPGIRSLSAVEQGIFKDLGYTIAQQAISSSAIFLTGSCNCPACSGVAA